MILWPLMQVQTSYSLKNSGHWPRWTGGRSIEVIYRRKCIGGSSWWPLGAGGRYIKVPARPSLSIYILKICFSADDCLSWSHIK